MKKAAALAALIILLSAAGFAAAVELQAGRIRSFDENILTVSSEDGGLLTIEAVNGTVPLKNPVTDMKIGGGTVEIPWDGLSFEGEPLTPGKVTLRATLRGADRTVEQTEIIREVYSPMPAVLCCLPAAQRFYADGKQLLRIECAVSNTGTIEVSIAPKKDPGTEVWHTRETYNRKSPIVISWNGTGKDRKLCPPGEYVISAWSSYRSSRVQTAEITLLPEPQPEPELAVTGSLIPGDLSDDAAVWNALTAPVAVGDGPEGKGLIIMNEKSGRSGRAGTVACRTTGVAVLEICGDGWVKVGAWRQADGFYTEGYVMADRLRMIRPNDRYGAVVDKKAQTMTVYERGKKLGTVLISTGWTTRTARKADTHSGIFLLGTRMESFLQDGHYYSYPIRIDAFNLIHQAGYALKNGQRDFGEETAQLGTKASHGCIRVDPRMTEENSGINMWWIWTHLGHDTKIIVTPEE